MATMITAECINCGACEPECPNTAIYQGGVEWELNGVTHPPLSEDLFYIVPEKCTECVGFHDREACAVVCPVDVCIPNPDIPETEEVLIARSKVLHPEAEFPPPFPSRFRSAEGQDAGVATAEAAPPAETAAPSPSAQAVKPAPETPPAAPTVAPQTAPTKPAAAASAPPRVEKPLSPPKVAAAAKPAPLAEKSFAGELGLSFEEASVLLTAARGGKLSSKKLMLVLVQPLLGALPFEQKRTLERAIDDRRYFTAAGATGLNVLNNLILYPLVLAALGAIFLDRLVFSEQLNSLIFLGMTIAGLEAIWRMREGFRGRPANEAVYRAACYGLFLGPLMAPLVGWVRPVSQQGSIGQDGFADPRFGEKIERERRYGQVYRVQEENNGFRVEVEFPRWVPPSAIKEELGIPDEMPDYEYDLRLQDGSFVVSGRITDPNIRKVAAVSPAFPPDFTTRIKLPSHVAGFRHRFQDKTLEVALLKKL